jgi:dihydrofolate synthase/folylpolyglutamate synthase
LRWKEEIVPITMRTPIPRRERMNYRETLEFLGHRGNEVQTMHLGLHRTVAMMMALGNPQDKYPSIHIAGTNGKGSVAAFSESILREAGLTTGLYTSPHLIRAEERIRVGGRQISPRSFASLATRIQETEACLLKQKILDRALTTFEFLTCCAFLHFAEKEIDVAVIEVGLGGKLDSTNVIHPQVSVITGISLDHQNLLGRTLTKIAGEKAGIIKRSTPAVSGCCEPSPRRVLRSTAKKVAAPLIEACESCKIRIKSENRGCYAFDLRTPRREYRNLRLSIAGEHQTRNAALAVLAIEELKSFPVRPRDIQRGLARAKWPGRLDEYRCRRRTLLDGAHNPEGARLLRDFLVKRNESEVHLVFGALRDKDIRTMGARLFPVATSIHLAPIANSRAASPEEIAGLHDPFRPRMRLHSNMREALSSAWNECSRRGLVVVTGSLYLIGDLLPVIRSESEPTEPRASASGFPVGSNKRRGGLPPSRSRL